MSRKKYVLLAVAAALSFGLCAGASGCADQSAQGSAKQEVKNTDPTKGWVDWKRGVDKRCDGSTMIYLYKESDGYGKAAAMTSVANAKDCAK